MFSKSESLAVEKIRNVLFKEEKKNISTIRDYEGSKLTPQVIFTLQSPRVSNIKLL